MDFEDFFSKPMCVLLQLFLTHPYSKYSDSEIEALMHRRIKIDSWDIHLYVDCLTRMNILEKINEHKKRGCHRVSRHSLNKKFPLTTHLGELFNVLQFTSLESIEDLKKTPKKKRFYPLNIIDPDKSDDEF